MAGLFVGYRTPNFSGLYHDWKMSGSYYNNYADYRVGSPITTQYHWWNTADVSWHGPILRIGCDAANMNVCGQFVSMHSYTNVSSTAIGSIILVFHINYNDI